MPNSSTTDCCAVAEANTALPTPSALLFCGGEPDLSGIQSIYLRLTEPGVWVGSTGGTTLWRGAPRQPHQSVHLNQETLTRLAHERLSPWMERLSAQLGTPVTFIDLDVENVPSDPRAFTLPAIEMVHRAALAYLPEETFKGRDSCTLDVRWTPSLQRGADNITPRCATPMAFRDAVHDWGTAFARALPALSGIEVRLHVTRPSAHDRALALTALTRF